MREIKFRAWDKAKREWCKPNDCGGLLLLSAEGLPVYVAKTEDGQWHAPYTGELADLINIQFYTGLRDKNGKEIYEGDVIYLAGYGDYEVEWPFIQLYQSSWEDDVGEIKGNIYESPELLEKS